MKNLKNIKRNSTLLVLLCIFSLVFIESCKDSETLSNKKSTEVESSKEKSFDWVSKKIEKGIVWKSFLGYSDIFRSNQSINVIEIDLNKTTSKLRLAQANKNPIRMTLDSLSETFKSILSINGTYFNISKLKDSGRSMSYFKSKGIEYQTINIPYNHQFSWMSEGCFYITEDENVGIKRGNRALYENLNAPHIMSGSPILIEEGIPVGKYFIPYDIPEVPRTLDSLNMLEYENPYRHQGIRHPRTAIGIKNNNTVVLVTVDGRAKEASGMAIEELTTLMSDYLGCYYALNLDGGGSTSMWIKEETENGIVNFPSGNHDDIENKFDHFGLRKILNAIILVPEYTLDK